MPSKKVATLEENPAALNRAHVALNSQGKFREK
jgi:hypothetical protein